MSRYKVFAIAFLVAAVVPLLMAQTSGFPSRPRFQAVGVGVAVPAGVGDLSVADDVNAADVIASGSIAAATGTINGSAIRTLATNGKVAFGTVSTAGALSNSLNVTSSSRSSAGQYTVNLTAAGFAAAPACVMTVRASFGYVVENGLTSTQLTVNTGDTTPALADRGFHFVCSSAT